MHCNAHKRVLQLAVLAIEIVHVVGCNKLYAKLLGKPGLPKDNLFVLWQVVVLNFDIKILAKNALEPKSELSRLIKAAL